MSMLCCFIRLLFLAADFFTDFRRGFGLFLEALFGLVLLVSLVVTVVNVINNDREGARRMIRWIILGAVGFILINLFSTVDIS